MQLDNDATKAGQAGPGSVSALDTANLPRHRWYFFKEAFSPEIVSHALQDTAPHKSEIILDPFSGSGTVPLTSTLQGYRAVGVEINPFLAFVSRTKLIQCEVQALKKSAAATMARLDDQIQSPLEGFSTFCAPDSGERDGKWLFNRDILRAFESGWASTQRISAPLKHLQRLSLIGAAMDTCNAVKDGKCLRYRRDWKALSFGKEQFKAAFEGRMARMAEDLAASPITYSGASIRRADARDITREALSGDAFRLCVTSPPYLNSFDYTDVYRPELFLGKFVMNMKELRTLRQRTIRSHLQTAWTAPREAEFGSCFQEATRSIQERSGELWNKRIPLMIQAYFEDIKRVLSRLRRFAKKDASVWIVVSNSAYAGVEIPVDLIIAEIAGRVGWYLREVTALRYLRRVPVQQWHKLSDAAREKNEREETKHNGPHLRESLVILDAAPRKAKEIIEHNALTENPLRVPAA